MFVFMCVILVIAALLLIVAVLIQPGKGAGLTSSGFSGISGQFSNMFGVRRATDFLQKFTIGIAIGILLLILITNKFFLDTSARTGGNTERAPITTGADKPPALQQPQQQQAQPAQQQAQPAQQQQQAPPQGQPKK